MRRKNIGLVAVAMAWILSAGQLMALGSPVSEQGAVSTGTIHAVEVTTTPAILYSTGTNLGGYSSGSQKSFFIPTDTNTVANMGWGQYMSDRKYLEIQNDSDYDIWVGYDSTVSSQALTTGRKGRRIPAGGSWGHDGSIKDYWAVSSSTTRKSVIVVQER